jgi:hypothetical protein
MAGAARRPALLLRVGNLLWAGEIGIEPKLCLIRLRHELDLCKHLYDRLPGVQLSVGHN